MNEITLMIRNLLDMECEHIKKGFVTKEFASNAITAFIKSLYCEGSNENEIKLNNILEYWCSWCKIYIENVNVDGTQK